MKALLRGCSIIAGKRPNGMDGKLYHPSRSVFWHVSMPTDSRDTEKNFRLYLFVVCSPLNGTSD